jgi:hypothetical protein
MSPPELPVQKTLFLLKKQQTWSHFNVTIPDMPEWSYKKTDIERD